MDSQSSVPAAVLVAVIASSYLFIITGLLTHLIR
jgi:hypothetical protein